MGNARKSKFQHIFYNLNKVRSKSGDKVKNTVKWYVTLLQREGVEGTTKWISKTKEKAQARIKRYGITQGMIDKALAKK